MHIQFSCTGGIANLYLTFEADADQLPMEKAKKLQYLITRANLSNIPPLMEADTREGADAFSYHLNIMEDTRNVCLFFTDVSAPLEVRPLLDYLRNLAIEEKMDQ